MYEQCLNFLGLREDPFHVSPDPRFYFSTPAHESALAELLFGIETRQGFMVLTGEAGTGKTCLLNQVLDWLHQCGRSSAFIFHTHIEPIGLLRFILRDFGVPCQSKSKSELIAALHTWLLERHTAGDLPVLILDEAQALPLQTLDELRLLLNLETPRGKLLQIILSGQPELDEKLRLPALRQLRQRIMFHSHLRLLTEQETAAYISRRLVAAGSRDCSLFPDEVVQDIYTSSVGVPRVVNMLCEHALISAYAEQQRVVSPEMIHRIAMDFDLRANPLSVSDAEPPSPYLRFDRFKVIENPERPTIAVEPAVQDNPVSAVPSSAGVEPPLPTAREDRYAKFVESCKTQKSWRLRQRRSATAVLARKSAAFARKSATFARRTTGFARRTGGYFSRAWRAVTHPILSYARSVRQSFVQDCRLFSHSLTPPTPALEHGSSASSTNGKPPVHRDFLAPIVNWLRRPIVAGHTSGDRSEPRSRNRK